MFLSSQYDQISTSFLNSTPANYQFNYATTTSQTQKIKADCRHLSERRNQVLHEVIEMEVKMGITRHWQPGDKEYLDMVKYLQMHRYYCALDKLQQLVIQCLFELQKLNLSRTGMLPTLTNTYLIGLHG
jgi:hypothetical protein